MRVLHISSVYPPQVVGGAEKVVALLAEHQAAAGHTVGAAFLAGDGAEAGERNGVCVLPQPNRNLLRIERVFASPRVLRTANKVGQLFNARTAHDFTAAAARFRPDIVHTHSLVELPPMVWAAARAAGARLVHTLHDYDLLCTRASLFKDGTNCAGLHASCRVAAGWKGHWARRIDAVAAVSAPVLAEHRGHGLFCGLPDACAQVIWNAAPAVTPRKARLRAPDATFTFGFLGRLVPEKGIGVLLDACRRLPAHGWRLRVAGHAQEGDDAYRAQAAGLPVEFLGFTDPAAFLGGIDLLVVPPIWREPFGLTVIEALGAGVPVIGTRRGVIPELLAPLGDDWLVPPGDAAALAARMRWAMTWSDGAFPPREAYAGLLDRLTPTHMAEAYDGLYAAALGSEPAAA